MNALTGKAVLTDSKLFAAGKVSLIVGGVSDIGKEVALMMGSEGSHIVVASRSQAALDDVCDAFVKAYGSAQPRRRCIPYLADW